jgi:hypothetical protein
MHAKYYIVVVVFLHSACSYMYTGGLALIELAIAQQGAIHGFMTCS